MNSDLQIIENVQVPRRITVSPPENGVVRVQGFTEETRGYSHLVSESTAASEALEQAKAVWRKRALELAAQLSSQLNEEATTVIFEGPDGTVEVSLRAPRRKLDENLAYEALGNPTAAGFVETTESIDMDSGVSTWILDNALVPGRDGNWISLRDAISQGFPVTVKLGHKLSQDFGSKVGSVVQTASQETGELIGRLAGAGYQAPAVKFRK